MRKWKAKGKTTCPGCKGALSLNKQVNAFAMETLNATRFACYKCSETFRYDKRKIHWRNCKDYTCTFKNCERHGHEYPTLDKLIRHWTDYCDMVTVKCSACSNKLLRKNINQHECVKPKPPAPKFLTCRRGHRLVYNSNIFARRVNGTVVCPQNIVCDKCRATFSIYNGYYRCDDSYCYDYDICRSCY